MLPMSVMFRHVHRIVRSDY